MVSGEWIDYADCQGRKHSHAHTHAHLVGLQFRSQLDVSCHTLCQLAKDEKRGFGRRMRVSNHRRLFVQSPAQIDGQCE